MPRLGFRTWAVVNDRGQSEAMLGHQGRSNPLPALQQEINQVIDIKSVGTHYHSALVYMYHYLRNEWEMQLADFEM